MNTLNPAFDGLTPWPDTLINRYRDSGYWGDKNLAQWLEQTLTNQKNNVVLSGSDINNQWQDFSGFDLLLQVRKLALGFHALGINCGDRVVMQLGNNNAFVLTLFALLELGVIPVMALPGHGFREIQHFLNLTQARTWITSDNEDGENRLKMAKDLEVAVPTLEHIIVDAKDTGVHHSLATLLDPSANLSIKTAKKSTSHASNAFDENLLPGHQVDPAGIALLLCSGGTTGLPKLIPRTHRDYIYNANASAEACRLSSEDCYLVALPAAHNFPLACPGILGAFNSGARVVMCPSPSPEIAYEWIAKTGATVTALVPPLLRVWLQNAQPGFSPPESLRLLQIGGARLDPNIAKRVHGELGCELQQVFGMAEGLLNFTHASDPDFLVYKTQGRPLSELDEIRIVDNNGQDVPVGTRGELWTRGPYTLRGYYKDDTANKKAFSADGYYQTGDLVRQLSSGHIIVEGRSRDVIRRGAETVPAESLETCLTRHTNISHAAVIGLPCERLGQQICAVLVMENTSVPKPTLSDIRSFLINQGVARFMLPNSIEFIEELPLTAVGKIAYKQLVLQFKSSSHNTERKGLTTS